MEGVGMALTPAQLQDRMKEARSWLEELNKNDATYESKKMVGESRLSNLQEALNDPVNWEYSRREREEDLRVAQEMNQFLPVTKVHQRPQSSHETASLPTGFAPYAGSSVNNFGGHFASDGVMAGQGRSAHAPNWNFGSENTTGPVTPTFSNGTERPSSASASSVDSAMPLPRKRQRQSLSVNTDSSTRISKARRPTPSPSMSGLNTPSSYGSLGPAESIPEDLFGLFGSDPNEAAREFKDSKKEQEEHMKAMEAKRQQERADGEFARMLQEEFNGQSLPAAMPRAGPSISNSNQTYLNANGQVQRPTPMSSSPVPIVNDPFTSTLSSSRPQNLYNPSNFPQVKQENAYYVSSGSTAVKTEPSHHPNPFSAPSNSFNDFINLDSDEEEEEGGGGEVSNLHPIPAVHPSSDLIEIDSQSWLESNNQAVPGDFLSGPSTNSGSYGTSEGIVNWNAITNTAQGYANNVYNAIGQTMSSFGSATGIGGTPVYDGDLTGSHLDVPTIDLDNDDYAPQSFYQQNMARAGLDPTNRGLVDIYRERYDYISHDPTRTAREMKELLENIRPDEDLPPENREGTPAAMVYPLMEHQKLGVAWMRRMEEGTNRGGSKSFQSPFPCKLS